MVNKLAKQIAILCCIIIFSLLGNSIALSKDKPSNTSDLEKKLEKKTEELTQAAKNTTMRKLGEIETYLAEGGWDIDEESGKLISASKAAQEKIAEIQTNIKNLFLVTAQEIEQGNSVTITVDSSGIGLPTKAKERTNRFLGSKENVNISIRSQSIAIKVLYRINRDLIDSAEREDNRRKKIDWYLTQAVFAYELSSVVIQMIDTLSSSDLEDLRKVYDEEMTELSKLETVFKKKAEGNNKQKKQQAEGWLKAIKGIRENWGEVLKGIGRQEDWVKNLKEKRNEFEGFAETAAYQVVLLTKGIIVEQVMEQMEAVREVLAFEAPPILYVDENLFAIPLPSDLETSTKIKAQ